MKREIKFRVWDIGKRVFIPVEVYGIVSADFNAFGVMLKDWENYREGEYFYDNSQVLSQYTGLTDKNGKDIYEGDIVKSHDHPTGVEDGIGEVYWKDGMWRLTWSMIPLGDYGTSWTEVIGNIYEHPHLLTPDPKNDLKI